MAKKRKIKKRSKAWQHNDKIIEEAAKPAEYPKFQKNKEYCFTTDKRPGGRNPTATKDPLYVFVGAIDSPYRKYPLYLFRHKKAGWCETFTPAQLDDFKGGIKKVSKTKEIAAQFRELSTLDLISVVGAAAVELGVRELARRETIIEKIVRSDESEG